MPSLRAHVAKLALENPKLKPGLVRVLRACGDETDAMGRYDEGPLSGPEKSEWEKKHPELAENVDDPPPGVKSLMDKMREKNASITDRNTLDQLVEMEAESSEMPKWRDAHATPDVVRKAKAFEDVVERALTKWVQQHPPATGDAGDMMQANGGYLVFMTLEGHGVGIWDGSWDQFYEDTGPLETFLKREVNREYHVLKTELEDAAWETAGGGEED
jgi:hypothetical protein